VPKIDWRDEDQPRRERRRRLEPRERRSPPPPGPLARRREVVEPVLTLAAPARRPLHLIWGAPQPRAVFEPR
jgi:hypothetical protein